MRASRCANERGTPMDKQKVLITTADVAYFLGSAAEKGFLLEQIQSRDLLSFYAVVSINHLSELNLLADFLGASVKLLEKQGRTDTILQLLKRPVLLAGISILLLLTFYLPTRVLFIQVEGNIAVQTWKILDCAECNGLGFGTLKRGIRSEQLKNALLDEIPQLTWAGINTRGCVAVIQVAEQTNTPSTGRAASGLNIVAQRDGIVKDLLVYRGTAVCAPGQAVQEGQLLISGYAMQGETNIYTGASAEISAYTTRELEAVSPAVCTIRRKKTGTRTQYSLIFGKKLINLYNKCGISGTGCDRISKAYYLTLPGGFTLPLGVRIIRTNDYDCAVKQQKTEDFSWIENAAMQYLQNDVMVGSVLKCNDVIWTIDDALIMRGTYDCVELIGRVSNEEIIQDNEQRN